MATVDPLLLETVNAVLADHCEPESLGAAEGGYDTKLWAALENSGLHAVGVAESAGGSGGTLHDAAAIAKAAGNFAAPVPITELSLMAGYAVESAGLSLPAGPVAVVIAGHEARVAWAPVAKNLVVVTPAGVSVRPASQGVGTTGRNYAGEPWATVELGTAAASPGATPAQVWARGALGRSLLMAGALGRAVDLSIQYANERVQFGRAIGKFQILQHYLAEIAGEAAGAEAAADNAVDVIASGAPDDEVIQIIAAAKAVNGRAAGTICRLAHQLHGAIGYTDEHRLHYTTRRLWSWRDEYGTEAEWAAVLGASLIRAGGAALWPTLTRWPPAAAG